MKRKEAMAVIGDAAVNVTDSPTRPDNASGGQ